MTTETHAWVTDGKITRAIPDAEPDPKTDPDAWLAWTINQALMKLLSDPRPLVYGEDGRLQYGKPGITVDITINPEPAP